MKRSRLLVLGLAFGLLPWAAAGDPLAGTPDFGTSVSRSFEARSLFSNPAGLGFETALDGPSFGAATLFSVDEATRFERAFALQAGPFGLGYESLRGDFGTASRVRAGLGWTVAPWLFAGLRSAWNSFPVASYWTFDLGLQLRPWRYASFGAVFNGVNQPTLASARQPIQYIFGVTVRPPGVAERWLEASFDADTRGDAFGRHWDSMGTLRVGPFDGWRVQLGYHSRMQWQAGLRFDLGAGSFLAATQPSPRTDRRWLGGIAFSSRQLEGAKKPEAAEVTVDGGLREKGTDGNLFRPGAPAFGELMAALDRVANDSRIRELQLRLERFPLGWAATFELQDALFRLRQSGKRVVLFLGQVGMREYAIAAAASEIVVDPAGELKLLGFRAQRYFLKGTLEKVGVEPQFLAAGKYKSAPEQFTQKQSSAAAKEAIESLLEGLGNEYAARLKKVRATAHTAWPTVLEQGLVGPAEAKRLGLIDTVEPMTAWKKRNDRAVASLRVPRRERLALPRRIAVVTVEGSLLRHEIPGSNLLDAEIATPDQLEEDIDHALADRLVDGIVLRVNSGGGEILASNELAQQVIRAAAAKPLVVSMGDAAASGGYFLAAPAPIVFAAPSTITGSIGVFLGSFHLEELYKKIDLHKETISRAPLANLDSESKSWTTKERDVYQRRVTEYYKLFTSYVAEQRKLDPKDVEASAQGRVWLGTAAKERKLVDRLGGLGDAIAETAVRAGGTSGDYDLRFFRKPRGFFDVLDLTPPVSAWLPLPKGSQQALRRAWLEAKLLEEPYLYFEPVSVE